MFSKFPLSLTSLLLVLLLTCLYQSAAIAQKRAVAVVYDNSGSMKGIQCDAVNYALQTMVGVLHPSDQLFVIPMADKTGKIHEIKLNQKQNEIDKVIKGLKCRGGNPFIAVDRAIERLNQTNKEKKWILMLSDGEWEDMSKDRNKKTLRQFLNKPDVQILFLNLDKERADTKNTLKTFLEQEVKLSPMQTEGKGSEIIRQMGDMAATVMSMPASGIKADISGNKVTINTKVPLKRLIVIEQEEQADLPKVSQAQAADGQTLRLLGPISASSNTANVKLAGEITHLLPTGTGEKAVIPKGLITITFDRPVDNQKFKFLPDAAAKLIPSIKGSFKGQKGNEYIICDSTQYVTVQAQLVDLEGNKLDKSVLATTRVFSIEEPSKKSSKLQLNKEDIFTYKMPLKEKEFSLSVSAQNDDYFNYKSNVFKVKLDTCPLPVAFLEANKTDLKADLRDMKNAEEVIITPIIKAGSITRPPTDEELEKLDVKLLNDPKLNIKVRKEGKKLYLKPASFICRCFTPTGKEQLQVQLSSSSKDIEIGSKEPLSINVEIVELSFFQHYGICILLLLLGLLLLWYLFGIIKKPRFVKGSEIILTKTSLVKGRPKSYPLPTSFFSRYLIPYVPETQQVGSISFKAGKRPSYVLIAAKTQTENMYLSGFPIESPGKKDLRLSNGEQLEIERNKRKETYEYRKI